jgi:PhnB protein
MLGVKPYLSFNGNCAEAINYYKDVLGGDILFMQRYGDSPMPSEGVEDLVMHTTLKVGDSVIMASDCPPGQPASTGNNVSLAVGVDQAAEADAMFARMAEGGNITMPIQETFWAERFGMLTDKFGVNWMFNCEKPHGDHSNANG